MSAFMAQAGNLVVLGDAGEALGNSIYEARLFVRGAVASLGADCIEKPMRDEHKAELRRAARRRPASTARSTRRIPALRLGPQTLQFPRRQSRGLLMRPQDRCRSITPAAPLRHLRPLCAIARSAAPRRPASTTSAAPARSGRLPHFDDLLFLGASISRYPLEGYREKCGTDVWLGTRHAEKPIHLKIPITIAGMSFGSLSAQAKEALGRGASARRHLDHHRRRRHDGGGARPLAMLVYQVLPSRYGMNPDDLRRADAIEIVVGQGAKPGGGGMLLGQKISERVADMRTLPAGIDQRSACRHPDWTGPDDLEIKIEELREITDWQKPIYVKVGAARPYYDTALAVKAGADVVVLDGMQGGTAATQEVFIENVGLPMLAAIRPAVQALQDLGHAPQGAAHRLGRHPQRRRRGEGAGARRRRGVDRHRGAGRARRQRPRTSKTSTARSARPPAPMTTGTRAAIRPASRRRTRSCERLDPVLGGRRSPTTSRC